MSEQATTRSSTPTSTWIRRFHPAPAANARLVCFPHAGGSASFYFPLSRALSPDLDVLAVQYPGRQDRRAEPCLDDVRRLADLVVAELLPWADRPMALFGHSLGATLAFEVALRLEDSGSAALGLFASGRRAPSRFRDGRVHLQDDEALIANLKKLSGTHSQIFADDEILRMILPAVRADYRAAESYRYRPGPPLTCPVTVLLGDDDPECTLDEARSWAVHTTAAFDLHIYPGGHFYLTEHAAAVQEILSRSVGRWQCEALSS